MEHEREILAYLANRYPNQVDYWEISNVLGLRAVGYGQGRRVLAAVRKKILYTLHHLINQKKVQRYWRIKKVRITESAMRSMTP